MSRFILILSGLFSSLTIIDFNSIFVYAKFDQNESISFAKVSTTK